MIRCDNDECPLSRECWRYIIAPQDADGVRRFEPDITDEYDHLLSGAGLSEAERRMMSIKCNNYIMIPEFPDHDN